VSTRDFTWQTRRTSRRSLPSEPYTGVRSSSSSSAVPRRAASSRKNVKIGAFAIIEMCEAVPVWFRPDGEQSEAAVAYLYGEYAVRLAGAATLSP